MSDKVPYELLGGEKGVRQLCDALYDAMDTLPEAETIRRMHKENLDEIRQKFFEYMSAWLGGPPLYGDKYGGMCIKDPHRPFAIGPQERDMWLHCMNKALEQIGASEEAKKMIERPLFNVADMLRNRDN